MTTAAGLHEEFEIAALRRARAALDGAAAERLFAHLTTCSACRGFAETAEATGRALRRRAERATAERDWNDVRAGFRRRLALDRSRLARGLLVVAAIVALNWWQQGPVSAAVVGGFAAVVVAVGLLAVVMPRMRRARRAETVDTDLLAYYRADLDREIDGLRKCRPFLGVLTVLCAAVVVLTFVNIAKDLWLQPRPFEAARAVVPILMVSLLAIPAWYRDRVVLPRLERERRELSV
jgi:hypothetical protein